MAYDNNDLQAVHNNFKKARQVQARVSRVLRTENASPCICGMVYKATIQAVLLFGSNTWCLTPAALKSLEDFHLQAAWCRVHNNKPCRQPNWSWLYSETPAVMEEVGLHPIAY